MYWALLKDGSIWRTNKFMDVAQYPIDSSSETRIWERRMLYCIPVSSLLALSWVVCKYATFHLLLGRVI